MEDLEKSCEGHAKDFRGLSSDEFAREFGDTNYLYQLKCFDSLTKEYKRQSENDRRINHPKLSSALESLSTAFYLVYKSMQNVCASCRKYLGEL